ncbi:LysR family transcriptional regulator [Saccharospirillum mangrovi]|uniref:LysR family transcriptional regulator n=1 Tax=Saccharospirillum mangrovi TaxID=2161747 RepID=UPI000D385D61|nr:LysR family transcriptional regulator [Saccharospirillum mangrovi]
MPDHLPNLRHLRAFSEVATSGSVSAAANQIFLSQSAVTQAIGKLESSLGTTLFLRRHNGMFLTDAGELFATRVNRCMAFLRTGTRDAVRIGERRDDAERNTGHQPYTLISNAHLRALLALQNATSYSIAARQIGISQPALYRAAGELEALLNTWLFEKTSVGISLTRAALRLARAARLAMKEVDQGIDELRELEGADAGTIQIGCMPLARTYVVPATINQMAQFKPDVNVGVIEGAYDDLLGRLLHGELDMLIGALRDPTPSPDIRQEQLFITSISVVARSGHPLVQRTQLTLDDLHGYGWVVPRPGTPARGLFDQVVTRLDPSVLRGVVECSSQIVIRELLTDSDRLTFISSHQVQHEIEEGILTVLDTQLPVTERPIGITTRTDWRPTPTQQLFLSMLRELSRPLANPTPDDDQVAALL